MIDITLQRALLLKALMEALQKGAGVARSKIEEEQPDELRNQWTRANATPQTLARGLDGYAETVGRMLDEQVGLLPDTDLWRRIRAFALSGTDAAPPPSGPVVEPMPAALAELRHWVEGDARPHTLAEVAGCWYLFRLSSQTDPDKPEVTVSVLNIRPEAILRENGAKWTEFALFLHPERKGENSYRVNGICTPSGDHLHFLGLLDKRSSYYPSAMSFRYSPGGRLPVRQHNIDGLMFVTNSHGHQISAPVFARYAPHSDGWLREDYQTNRATMLQRLGSHPISELEDIFPADEYKRLIDKTAEGLIFEAD
jgi:hypothetical protein